MRVVILAAGEGRRLKPLTANIPKPLVSVAGKPILQWVLDELAKIENLEALIVIGHLGQMIIERFGSHYKGMHLSYTTQFSLLGTGHAVMLAHAFTKDEPFFVYLADTYIVDNMRKIVRGLLTKNGHALVVSRVSPLQALRSGQVVISGDRVVEIVEKPKTIVSDIVSAGMYYFQPSIFRYLERSFKGGVLELATSIQDALGHEDVRVVLAKAFLDIGTIEGLNAANDYFGRKAVA